MSFEYYIFMYGVPSFRRFSLYIKHKNGTLSVKRNPDRRTTRRCLIQGACKTNLMIYNNLPLGCLAKARCDHWEPSFTPGLCWYRDQSLLIARMSSFALFVMNIFKKLLNVPEKRAVGPLMKTIRAANLYSSTCRTKQLLIREKWMNTAVFININGIHEYNTWSLWD